MALCPHFNALGISCSGLVTASCGLMFVCRCSSTLLTGALSSFSTGLNLTILHALIDSSCVNGSNSVLPMTVKCMFFLIAPFTAFRSFCSKKNFTVTAPVLSAIWNEHIAFSFAISFISIPTTLPLIATCPVYTSTSFMGVIGMSISLP